MGVSVDVTLPSDITATYHRIDGVPKISWNDDGTGKIELAISQYVSYEARQAGASPVNRTFKSFDLDKDITGIIRYVLYRGVLPLIPEFSASQTIQDGELGNMLRLLRFLNPAEMSAMIFALQDILQIIGVDPEAYRDWYESLKADTLSTIG